MLIAGNTADLWTTHHAFQQGGRELNPVTAGHDFGRVAIVKAATTGGLALVMRALEQHGHPSIAKWIGYLGGGSSGAVAIRNLAVAR